nr:MAG TPA: Nuclease [Caudoviricetes sp.]
MKNFFLGLFRSDETITEKQVEQKFTKAVKASGGLALKFVSPGRVGVPDRIVLLPGGKAVFAEIKRPGGHLRKSQEAACREIRSRGFPVHIIRSGADIEQFCDWYLR